MSIELAGTTRRGRFQVDAEIDVPTGERLALLGENGSGKSTLLRVIAGLLPLQAGSLRLGGEPVDEPGRQCWVEPQDRPIGFVPQQAWLFPHLTVAANVAFGPRRRGEGRREAHRLADEWLTRVGLGDVAERRPGELSGGQAQRVAFARALATEPQVLLLDEPLASLDQEIRSQVRRLLRDDLVTKSRTTVLVTHDPVDALALADRVAVMDRGRVVQSGTAVEVTSHPKSPFVAELAGLNLLEGSGRGREMTLRDGTAVVTATPVPDRALATIAPRAVTLHLHRPEGSARNVWPGVVDDLESVGDRIRVRVRGPVSLVAEVTPPSVASMELGPGSEVWQSVKATEIDVYPA